MLTPLLTPDRDALPFLVVHGAWLWKAALVVMPILGAIAWQRLRHRWATRLARRALSATPGTVTTMREGPLALRGRLQVFGDDELSGERVLRCAGGDPEDLSAPEAVIAIEQGDAYVLLDGPVVVASGTSARSSRRRQVEWDELVDLETGEKRKPERVYWSILNTLRDGDEVEVHGVAKLVPGLAGTDYRTSAGSWHLHGDPLRIHAVRPRALASPVTPLRATAMLTLLAVTIWGALHGAGAALEDDVNNWRGPVETGELSTLSVAAALPSTRAAALERYAAELTYVGGPVNVRRLLALADVTGQCDVANRVLIERHRWDALLERGRQCADRDVELQALMGLGRFDEAADLVEAAPTSRPFVEGLSLISAARWGEAAVRADAMARAWDARVAEDQLTQERKWSTRMKYTCLAELFRWRGGDELAGERLGTLARRVAAPACQVIATEVLSGEERLRALERLHRRMGAGDDDVTEVASWFLWAEGARDRNVLRDVIPAMRRFDPRAEPWLAPFAVAVRTAENADRGEALAQLALWQLMKGDLDGATRTAASAAAILPEEQSVNARRIQAAVALRDRASAGPVDDEIEGQPGSPLTALRRGEAPASLPDFFVADDACAPEALRALAAAAAGDGRPLALVVVRCRLDVRAEDVILTVGPRLRTGTDELSVALTWYLRRDLAGVEPVRVFANAASYRDLFRAIGDDEGAAWWAEVVDRHARVLADRDRAVGLRFWEM